MPIQRTPAPRRLPLRPLVAALLAAAAGSARADEPSPWYVGASETLTHDSNVYRIPGGTGDTYSTTSLLGGVDQAIGRQRVHATANVGYNKYSDQTTLDNTSYKLDAGLDWETAARLSGNVGVSLNQSLASFDGNANQPVLGRNVLTADQFTTGVNWGGNGLLSVTGNYSYSKVKYSAAAMAQSQSSTNSGSLGVNYNLSTDIMLGVAYRLTRTESPYAVLLTSGDYQSNTADGRNIDLLLNWRTTAQTGLNARLSWTHQSNSNLSGADFSGLTGSISGNYAPTAKLSFSGTLSRDVGANSSFLNIPVQGSSPIVAVTQNNQKTDLLQLGANYAATAKIGVRAGLLLRRGTSTYDTGLGGTTVGSSDQTDRMRRYSLGADWAIARAWQLSCDLAHESRDVSGAAGYTYGANTIGCTAQFTLR